MNISAEIPKIEFDKMRAVLDKVGSEVKKSSASILRQGMIFAVQSAAKETEPGKTQKPSKLQVKYKYRPIVKYKPDVPVYVDDTTGKYFESEFKQTAENIRKVTKAWKYWDKKRHQWAYMPYTSTATKKYDKEASFSKIPFAGAAKAGWLKALNSLPTGNGYHDASTGTQQPRVKEKHSGQDHEIIVENLIKYIAKTSPNAASMALSKATDRMIGSYKKKIDGLEKYKM